LLLRRDRQRCNNNAPAEGLGVRHERAGLAGREANGDVGVDAGASKSLTRVTLHAAGHIDGKDARRSIASPRPRATLTRLREELACGEGVALQRAMQACAKHRIDDQWRGEQLLLATRPRLHAGACLLCTTKLLAAEG
jgi:hypothetical protein